MKANKVTARYVEALYNLGVSSGQLETFKSDVERLAATLARPGVLQLVLHPAKTRETRQAYLEGALSGASSTVKNFISLLFDKRREGILTDFGDAFHQRLLEAAGVVEGVVTSARPLGAGEIAELTVSLGAKLGKEVRLKNEVDASLVAGVRVMVDSRMIDCSVAGRMDGIRRRMLNAPLPQSV
jgi:F-type H+-transporting ATPase subunit delta